VEDDTLHDVKHGEQFPLGSTVWLYNAESNTLQEINTQAVGVAIAALPDVPRHWLQLGDDNLLRTLVLKVMPRLEYAFKR